MSIIYVLIPIAVLLTTIGIYLFFWAVKTEQFDDLEKQGMSILFDDEHDKVSHNKSTSASLNVTQVKETEFKDNQTNETNKAKNQVDNQNDNQVDK
ncbi:cbb3-type cytochrome oxidase assembly protein CcoS [Colwellia sp. PAMC 21821]|uniref:cbb3-type cytochrome oxidase assembly protein CcoS n=1 Tax=Colwellia sp. PAMC 21821 TaxID=1816219 RepID=UPI0009BFBCA9|nr:cbb3-type cytochrome oxidase assembly protein CcoS [Colwellia sp. PAMC 21821]ARD43080.1 hypothetical protein A3Q33_01295 [Colwellia sp. PAMC 21821]